jgi:hypothetical protein
MPGIGSKGRFRCVQLKDGGLGRLRRREANGGQHIFELLSGPSSCELAPEVVLVQKRSTSSRSTSASSARDAVKPAAEVIC